MTASLSQVAREAGKQASERCTDKAQRADPEFSEKASTAILAHLQVVRTATGEELTDVAIAQGARCSDARAFGSIFAGLLRKHQIHVIGYAPRRKGHGCMGAKIYAIQH